MNRFLSLLTGCVFLFAPTVSLSAVKAPVLKWQYGGCYASWCETGWYSSPAVTDLDGDGKKEILYASYDGRMHAFWLDKTEHHDWPFSASSLAGQIKE